MELGEFQIERIDYKDPAGINKCVLVAARGSGGLAFCGHMDTVPHTGWTTDPWSGHIDGDVLHGLGSTDMKGPLASLVGAATTLPASIPIALFITTDEETTKQGAQPDRPHQRTRPHVQAPWHPDRRADQHGPGPRPSQPHRVHRGRDRSSGA